MLLNNDLVIADASGPIALAGIIGGSSTSINSNTKTVLLESAYFNPKVIRKTVKLHNINTESSYRFERGTDPNGVLLALDRAAQLISMLCVSDKISTSIDYYYKKVTPCIVMLTLNKVLDVSGLSKQDLTEKKVCNILSSLGIELLSRNFDKLFFQIPTFRLDICESIDLIEEILRIIGYNKIPISNCKNRYLSTILSKITIKDIVNSCRNLLVSLGFFEVINFSFGDPNKFNKFLSVKSSNLISIKNPLGKKLSVLRSSLLPGLLNNIFLNMKSGNINIKLFEIGNVFLGFNKNSKLRKDINFNNLDLWVNERLYISGIIVGNEKKHYFLDKIRDLDFFDIKGYVETLLSNLKISCDLSKDNVYFARSKIIRTYMHPNINVDILLKTKNNNNYLNIGYLGLLHTDISYNMNIKKKCFIFELNLYLLYNSIDSDVKFHSFSKFPYIRSDLSLLMSKKLDSIIVVKYIKNSNILNSLLISLDIIDVYDGARIPFGMKSITFSLVLQSNNKTLLSDYVDRKIKDLIKALEEDLNIKLRF